MEIEEMDVRLAQVKRNIDKIKAQTEWIRSRKVRTGMNRLCYLLATIALIVMICIGDDTIKCLVATVIVVGATFGMAKLAMWVIRGFME